MGAVPLERGERHIKDTLKIGTRGSALALTQAHLIAERITHQWPGLSVDIVVIKTKGDIMQDVPLATIGGKGIFVKEIEEALLRSDIDMAVHSMKDVPVEIPEGLEISVLSEREDPRDVLISNEYTKIEHIPAGARIGTGSLRRGFQLRHLFPGMEIVPLRGNLDTRIRKIQSENLDGIIVAAAGMKRMGWTDRITQYIPVEIMLPSVGQGVLGIELRKNDDNTRNTVSFINHRQTLMETNAERAFLKRLGGGCQLPIAAYGIMQEKGILLKGLLGSLDGKVMIRDEVRGDCEEGEALGTLLAERILSKGGKGILDEVYEKGNFCGETG